MNAINDAGLRPKDIDGMTSYQIMDSCSSTDVASALGLQLNYGVDVIGGGSSGEMLVANAIGIMEGGYAKAFVIFRSMLGRTGLRMGGQAVGGPRGATPASGTFPGERPAQTRPSLGPPCGICGTTAPPPATSARSPWPTATTPP